MGKRPTCHNCGEPLSQYRFFGHKDIDPDKKRRWGYEGNGIFCTLRCGFNWALSKLRRDR